MAELCGEGEIKASCGGLIGKKNSFCFLFACVLMSVAAVFL
jgi:hypothetical protein